MSKDCGQTLCARWSAFGRMILDTSASSEVETVWDGSAKPGESTNPDRFPDEGTGWVTTTYFLVRGTPRRLATVRGQNPPSLEQGWWAHSVRSGGLGLRKRAPASNPWARLVVVSLVPATTSAHTPGLLVTGVFVGFIIIFSLVRGGYRMLGGPRYSARELLSAAGPMLYHGGSFPA